MADPVDLDLHWYSREQERADSFAQAVDERLANDWLDLEKISEAIADTDACYFHRAVHAVPGQAFSRDIPENATGAPALRALRERRFEDFGRLVYAAVEKRLREQAEDAQRDFDIEQAMDAQVARAGY